MVLTRGRKIILAGTLGAAVLAGGTYAGTALAQSSSGSPASSSGSVDGRQAFVNHLTQRLGLSDTAKVQQALKDASKDVVADQVAAGKLTQAQATQIDQRIDSGQGPAGFGGRPGRGNGGGPNGAPGQALTAAAQALNLQPADLRSQLRSGKSLADIAQAQNVDLAKVTTAVTNAIKPQLDQAVSSGRLTQQQETDILSRIGSGNFPGRRGFGAGPGGRPHRDGSPAPSASASAG